MHPSIAKAREIAALEAIVAKQDEILARQDQILARLEAPAPAPPAKPPKDK